MVEVEVEVETVIKEAAAAPEVVEVEEVRGGGAPAHSLVVYRLVFGQ